MKPRENEEIRGCEAAPRSGAESLARLSASGTSLDGIRDGLMLLDIGMRSATVASRLYHGQKVHLGVTELPCPSNTIVFASAVRVTTRRVVSGRHTFRDVLVVRVADPPQSFAAYKQKLTPLLQLVAKRKLAAVSDPAIVRKTWITFTQACSAARPQVASAQKKVERCATSAEACGANERGKAAARLDKVRGEWRNARVEEILAKMALRQQETPSAVCSSW